MLKKRVKLLVEIDFFLVFSKKVRCELQKKISDVIEMKMKSRRYKLEIMVQHNINKNDQGEKIILSNRRKNLKSN